MTQHTQIDGCFYSNDLTVLCVQTFYHGWPQWESNPYRSVSALLYLLVLSLCSAPHCSTPTEFQLNNLGTTLYSSLAPYVSLLSCCLILHSNTTRVECMYRLLSIVYFALSLYTVGVVLLSLYHVCQCAVRLCKLPMCLCTSATKSNSCMLITNHPTTLTRASTNYTNYNIQSVLEFECSVVQSQSENLHTGIKWYKDKRTSNSAKGQCK